MPSIPLYFEQNGEHFFQHVFFTLDDIAKIFVTTFFVVAAKIGILFETNKYLAGTLT